jgi:hypothetical protein
MTLMVAMVAAVVSAGLMAPSAAQAASGGGCKRTSTGGMTISSCISYTTGTVWPDFYVEALPAGCYVARMDAYDSGRGYWVTRGNFPITRTGRYVQLNLPVSGTGWSQTDVTVTRCAGSYLMSAYSPRINFP